MKISKRRSNKYIPPEILTLILAKLPAKTLLRFRCVCKSWRSNINHSDFISMHLKLSKNNKSNSGKQLTFERFWSGNGCGECLLTLREADTFRKQTEIFLASKNCFLHGTCHSLLLISRSRNRMSKGLRLYNPSNRKSLLLPPFPCLPSGWYEPTFILGFELHSQDYKVIAIAFRCITGVDDPEMRVAVYTLSDQQWAVRDNILNIDYSSFENLSRPYYFCEGAAHWLKNAPYGDNQYDNQTHLVSLDFDSEQFTFLELPVALDERDRNKGSLFLLGESLAFFCMSPNSFRIWVLKQESGKRLWTLWFSGPSSDGGLDLFYYMGFAYRRVLYFEGDGSYILFRNRSYNIVTCEVQYLENYNSCNFDFDFELATYCESLVLCNQSRAVDIYGVIPSSLL